MNFKEIKKNKELVDYIKSNLPDPKNYIKRYSRYDVENESHFLKALYITEDDFKEDNTHWFDINTNEYCIFTSKLYDRDLHNFCEELRKKIEK